MIRFLKCKKLKLVKIGGRIGTTNTTRPFDRITGYTISEIEAVIGASDNIADLRDNLRNQYPNNPTRDFLNELFEQYINLAR